MSWGLWISPIRMAAPWRSINRLPGLWTAKAKCATAGSKACLIPLLDMRPQGFLGRNFAHLYGQSLEVAENLNDWTDDDVAYVLATLGHDQSGDLILGERAYQRHLDARHNWESRVIATSQIAAAYPNQAELALAQGVAGSSAAGEFPKFTAMRELNGDPVSVIVKFSGADDSAAVRRWADLLVCEHLALETLSAELGIATARSTVHRYAGRTFLEVVRFDRCGPHGRLPVCALSSLNGALLGKAGASWPALAVALHQNGWLPAEAVGQVALIWWFGRLIANTDMHEGNLSFHPGLSLAPVYDMLPMRYAPQRGGEVPPQTYAPALPLPTDALEWHRAAMATIVYLDSLRCRCSNQQQLSGNLRRECGNAAAGLGHEPASSLAASLLGQWRCLFAGPPQDHAAGLEHEKSFTIMGL